MPNLPESVSTQEGVLAEHIPAAQAVVEEPFFYKVDGVVHELPAGQRPLKCRVCGRLQPPDAKGADGITFEPCGEIVPHDNGTDYHPCAPRAAEPALAVDVEPVLEQMDGVPQPGEQLDAQGADDHARYVDEIANES